MCHGMGHLKMVFQLLVPQYAYVVRERLRHQRLQVEFLGIKENTNINSYFDFSNRGQRV